MTYWDKILKEILNKQPKSNLRYKFTNVEPKYCEHDEEHKCFETGAKYRNLSPLSIMAQEQHTHITPCEIKTYALGNKHPGIYFTRREADCMVHLLKGKTVGKIATSLHLSPRTIEFYLRNMRSKLGCRSKFELMEIVSESDFLRNIDFV